MSDDFGAVLDEFDETFNKEVENFLDKLGREAVDVNIQNGNYHDKTGNLRRSNFYKVNGNVLTVGNRASYATKVSSRGFDVVDSGIHHIEKELEGMR